MTKTKEYLAPPAVEASSYWNTPYFATLQEGWVCYLFEIIILSCSLKKKVPTGSHNCYKLLNMWFLPPITLNSFCGSFSSNWTQGFPAEAANLARVLPWWLCFTPHGFVVLAVHKLMRYSPNAFIRKTK